MRSSWRLFGRSSPAWFSWASTGFSAARFASVSSREARTTRVPTFPSRSREVSIVVSCSRWSARIARPFGSSRSTPSSSPRRCARLALSRSMPSMARTISAFWSSRPPTKVSSCVTRLRMSSVRPRRALFSSVSMTLSCPTPPPLSSIERAASTSSTSGLRPVRSSGMRSPSPSRPVPPPSGRSRATYFSPSSEVCLSSARVSSGRSLAAGTRIVTRAVQPSRSMAVTSPTVTSSIFTEERGTRSRTSANSARTVICRPSAFGPPGSGRS